MPRPASDTKNLALAMHAAGHKRSHIRFTLGISKSLLDCWLRRGHNPGTRVTDRNPHRVDDVRNVLRMMEGSPEDGDEPVPRREISRKTGITRQTMRRWRDEAKFRDATFEYDPEFTYNPNDMLDRMTVAHHLCTETDDVMERFDLMMLGVRGFPSDLTTSPIPRRAERHHNDSYQRTRA